LVFLFWAGTKKINCEDPNSTSPLKVVLITWVPTFSVQVTCLISQPPPKSPQIPREERALHKFATTYFSIPNYSSPTLSQSFSLIWSKEAQKREIPISMASILSAVGAGFSCSKPPTEGLKQSRRGTTVGTQFGSLSFGDVGSATRPRRVVVVRAEGPAINPEIRKSEAKVVDSVVVTELSKPLTAYCR